MQRIVASRRQMIIIIMTVVYTQSNPRDILMIYAWSNKYADFEFNHNFVYICSFRRATTATVIPLQLQVAAG